MLQKLLIWALLPLLALLRVLVVCCVYFPVAIKYADVARPHWRVAALVLLHCGCCLAATAAQNLCCRSG